MASKHDFLLVGAGRLATAVVALLATRVSTTFLVPAQYGELALLVVVQLFCGLFLINPVGQYINRHTHEWWDDGTLLARLTAYRNYVLGVCALGAVITLVVSRQQDLGQLIVTVTAMVLMVGAGTWNATVIPMLNMVGYRWESVAWAVATSVGGLISSVMLMQWEATATYWFLGQSLGMVLGALGAALVLQHHARLTSHAARSLSFLNLHTIISYCLPLALATGFMWLQLSGYRFVVKMYWGLEALGYLAVGFLVVNQIWILVETLAQQFLYPLFYRRITGADANSSSAALSDLLNVMGPLYLVLAGTTFLGAPYILKLLAAPHYAEAAIFVKLGTAIECCRVLGNLFGNAAQVTKRTQSMAFPYIVGATLSLAMILVAGEYRAELIWVGFSLALAAAVMLLVMRVVMYREVRYTIDVRRWYAGLAIMAMLALTSRWLASPSSWWQTIGVLAAILLLGGVAIAMLLWNSSALARLVAVDLRVKVPGK